MARPNRTHPHQSTPNPTGAHLAERVVLLLELLELATPTSCDALGAPHACAAGARAGRPGLGHPQRIRRYPRWEGGGAGGIRREERGLLRLLIRGKSRWCGGIWGGRRGRR
ncbi:hypothetical protein SEVIR_4G120756v4 [Setaria viridis]